MTHLTELCEHPAKDLLSGQLIWCIVCENACPSCGLDAGFSDSTYCEKCEFERDVMRAEFAHDLMKEGA